MDEINRNMVNRKCKYFNQPEKCVLLQPECNCYQCPIVEWEINKKDLALFRKRLDELEKENKELKILLADKILENTRTPKERGADKPKTTCLNCKHLMFSDCYGECNKQLRIVNPSDTCEYAEPKERGGEK